METTFTDFLINAAVAVPVVTFFLVRLFWQLEHPAERREKGRGPK